MSGPAARNDAFKTIAGVTPCPGGWLVLPARLAGVTVAAEEAFVLPKLMEVLDYRPKFEFAAVNIPFGYPETPGGPFRRCDDEARELVQWPRRIAVRPVPSRASLFAKTRQAALEIDPWLTKNDFRRFRWMREAAIEIQPFHARSFYSANADLSFVHMNGDEPLGTWPHHEDGMLQRLELVRSKLPGVDDVVSRLPPVGAGVSHMYEAAAMLWTARRASGRAISRVPLDPEWDDGGIRIELVR
jgi:predicted RNase H-like nuclease